MKGTPSLPPQAQQLLEQLNDINTPGPVGIWPLAPGWWLLAGLALALVGLFGWRLWQRQRANRYRKTAANELIAMSTEHDAQFVTRVSALLKRTVLTAYPGACERIGRLHGTDWVDFLNDCCRQPVFRGDAAAALARGLYQRAPSADTSELKKQALAWIKHHQRAARLSRPRLRRQGVRHV